MFIGIRCAIAILRVSACINRDIIRDCWGFGAFLLIEGVNLDNVLTTCILYIYTRCHSYYTTKASFRMHKDSRSMHIYVRSFKDTFSVYLRCSAPPGQIPSRGREAWMLSSWGRHRQVSSLAFNMFWPWNMHILWHIYFFFFYLYIYILKYGDRLIHDGWWLVRIGPKKNWTKQAPLGNLGRYRRAGFHHPCHPCMACRWKISTWSLTLHEHNMSMKISHDIFHTWHGISEHMKAWSDCSIPYRSLRPPVKNPGYIGIIWYSVVQVPKNI